MANADDLNTAVRRYVAALAMFASLSLVVPAVLGLARFDVSRVPLAGLLLISAILTQHFPIHLTDKTKVYVDTAILTAAVLMLPPMMAVSLAILSAVTYELTVRVSWEQGIFNIAQTAVYVGIGAWVYRLVAMPRGAPDLTAPLTLLAALVSIATMHLCNTLAVAIIVALQLGKPPISFWLDGLLIDLPEQALLSANGVLFAVAANSVTWITPLLIGPLVLVYLSLRQSAELRTTTRTMVETLADLSDLLCREAPGHSRRVAERTRQLAERLALPRGQTDVAVKAAQLQAIGVMGADPSDSRHCRNVDLERSARLATMLPSYGPVAASIRHLRERWDGTGAPDGLAGETIPLPARLVAVAEAFERFVDGAKPATTDEQLRAANSMVAGAGAVWDPRIVSALNELVQGNAAGAD